MVYYAFEMIFNSFMAASDWFMSCLDQTGAYKVWLTAVLISISFRFIFAPVFGYAKSDLAKRSYNAFKRRKEE